MKSAVSFTMSEVVANFIRFNNPQILDEEASRWSSEDTSEDEDASEDEDDTTTTDVS